MFGDEHFVLGAAVMNLPFATLKQLLTVNAWFVFNTVSNLLLALAFSLLFN